MSPREDADRAHQAANRKQLARLARSCDRTVLQRRSQLTNVLGIHSDLVRHRNGEVQSFSQRWTELAQERGIAVKQVDSGSPDFFRQLAPCQGFMWRFGYSLTEIAIAKRILQGIEYGMRIPVFPNARTAWHFEDKIAQHYLLSAARFPTPSTTILWNEEDALEFCETASYPFVLKLASGFQSRNVRLVRSRAEAVDLTRRLFKAGMLSLDHSGSAARRILGRSFVPVKLLLGRSVPADIQSGYLFAQEFLPDNEFDTRVTVIGKRAFAFRRFNRPGDFRASGSGRIDWDPAGIDPEMIMLAFRLAAHLGTQSLAIDGLKRGGAPVIGEISYTYASWAVRDCPGHWRRSDQDMLEWVPGKLRPEDAIFEDFVELLPKQRLELNAVVA